MMSLMDFGDRWFTQRELDDTDWYMQHPYAIDGSMSGYFSFHYEKPGNSIRYRSFKINEKGLKLVRSGK